MTTFQDFANQHLVVVPSNSATTSDISASSPSTPEMQFSRPDGLPEVGLHDSSLDMAILESSFNKFDKQRRRPRATPEQLELLEKTFRMTSTPNARLREELGKRLSMTERSIQIWFQNKRAKLKSKHRSPLQLHKGPYNNAITYPLSPLHSATLQGFNSRNSLSPTFNGIPIISPSSPRTPFLPSPPMNQQLLLPHAQSHQEISNYLQSPLTPFRHTAIIVESDEHPIFVDCITIGQWQQLCHSDHGHQQVECNVSLSKGVFIWKITHPLGHLYQIVIPFDSISSLALQEIRLNHSLDSLEEAKGEAVFLLTRPPTFWQFSPNHSLWTPCGDFTENDHVTGLLCHRLQGSFEVLRKQLGGLVALDSRLQSLIVVSPVPTLSFDNITESVVSYKLNEMPSMSSPMTMLNSLVDNSSTGSNSVVSTPSMQIMASQFNAIVNVPQLNNPLSANTETGFPLLHSEFFGAPLDENFM
jgi:hypothetical protein